MTTKSFDSLVLSMARKVLNAGENLRIYMPATERLGEIDGEVDHVDYWSTENVVNFTYRQHDPDSEWRVSRKDWRFRPLSATQFDDMFTLKKRDGKITFMLKPKMEDGIDEGKKIKSRDEAETTQGLSMAGELALRTIKKHLANKQPVRISAVKGLTSEVKQGLLSNLVFTDGAWRCEVGVEEGWTAVVWLGTDQMNGLSLKSTGGALTVSSKEKE